MIEPIAALRQPPDDDVTHQRTGRRACAAATQDLADLREREPDTLGRAHETYAVDIERSELPVTIGRVPRRSYQAAARIDAHHVRFHARSARELDHREQTLGTTALRVGTPCRAHHGILMCLEGLIEQCSIRSLWQMAASGNEDHYQPKGCGRLLGVLSILSRRAPVPHSGRANTVGREPFRPRARDGAEFPPRTSTHGLQSIPQ